MPFLLTFQKIINWTAYFFSFQTCSENYCFCYQRELAQNIAHRQLPLQRKPVSGSVGSSYSVVWLRVKPVGALVMENRCGNGLVLLLYPPAASLAVMKNNGFIPEGRRPQVTPSSPFPHHHTPLPPPSPPHDPASLQRLCWRANRWLGWVASGLCALSVIKERKKVYGLLVSVLPTDGMSSKHPPISNLWREGEGVLRGWAWAAICHAESSPPASVWNYTARYAFTIWLCSERNESNSTDIFEYLWSHLHNVDAQKATEVNANIFQTSLVGVLKRARPLASVCCSNECILVEEITRKSMNDRERES